jgi:hypothetical protein
LVEKVAIKLELNDIRKRKAIQEKTGLNSDSAIAINIETNENTAAETTPERRVTNNETQSSEAAPVRRYNVSHK